MTEYFATFVGVISRMLVRVPGHTEADETLEVIRRILQPVQIIATSVVRSHFMKSFFVTKWGGFVHFKYVYFA